jgi:hypothetical protein
MGPGGVATAVDGSPSWKVTVGDASRTLYPGTSAAMAYDVRNATPGSLRLRRTTAAVHLKGASSACRAEWFRIDSNTVPTDIDVAPGGSLHGSLVLAFDNLPGSQDVCQDIGVEVVVTAS